MQNIQWCPYISKALNILNNQYVKKMEEQND